MPKTDRYFVITVLWHIDARSIQFFFSFLLSKLRIAPFTEVGFEQFLVMNKISPSGFTVSLTSPEAATKVFYRRSCSLISQYSQENACVSVSFCVSFIKNRLQHRCFPVNIVKFLRILILKNSCERLLLILTLESHRRVPP